MTKNRFSKPVAFNSNNLPDQQILEYVKKRNFSGYVKKLILADIAKNNTKEAKQTKLELLQEKLNRSNNVNNDSNESTDTESNK